MTESVGLPKDREPALRVMPRPADVNARGDIFGGWIMSHVDTGGGIIAERRARGRVVTVAVNEFAFKQPVFVGDLLSIYGDIVRVGNTSIAVKVEVYAQRKVEDIEVIRVTEAICTYVAIDVDGKPRRVPPPR